jgi:hypothetical protein
MINFSADRRRSERRASSRGGRRATDRPASTTVAPCRCCGEVPSEVGASDGGWWFVCGGCDDLWNERERLPRGGQTI